MTDMYIAAAIIIFQALALTLLRARRLGRHRSNRLDACGILTGRLFLIGLATFIGGTLSLALPPRAALPISGISWLAITAFETIDLTSCQYFGAGILRTFRFLLTAYGGETTFQQNIAYIVQYFPFPYLLQAEIICLTGFSLNAAFTSRHNGPTILAAGAACSAAFLLYAIVALRHAATPITTAQAAFLNHATPFLRIQKLETFRRASNILLATPPAPPPGTILLIINESAGADLPASDGRTPLAEALRTRSGHAPDWITPDHAVTNSSCTDISIPSILTGCGAHESIAKLNQMPFIFDLAKARGYQTAFFTSSTLRWAGFDRFFAGAEIDELVCAESFHGPFVNDLTVDDHLAATRAAAWLQQTTGPVLLVVYLNALHVPYQTESQCEIPPDIPDRRNRAAFITESCHALLFGALESSGRYAQSLIFSAGDHGEISRDNDAAMPAPSSRLINLTKPVLEPLFILKPPAGLPPPLRAALMENAKSLVTNLDIAPSIAHLLGAAPRGSALHYAGFSLFQDIPPDRVVYTLNTNEWRSWHRGAAAISQGDLRIIVDYQTAALSLEQSITAHISAAPERGHDNLLLKALNEPFMRRAISEIFKDKTASRQPCFF